MPGSDSEKEQPPDCRFQTRLKDSPIKCFASMDELFTQAIAGHVPKQDGNRPS